MKSLIHLHNNMAFKFPNKNIGVIKATSTLPIQPTSTAPINPINPINPVSSVSAKVSERASAVNTGMTGTPPKAEQKVITREKYKQWRNEGKTAEQIKAFADAKGYKFVDTSEQQNQPIEETKKPNFLSSLLGGLGRVATTPQSLMTEVAGSVGENIGVATSGLYNTPEGQQVLKEMGQKRGERIANIPQEIIKGFKEGIFSESKMQTPSKEIGLEGGAGLAVDILGDPLNFLMFNKTEKIAKVLGEKTPSVKKFAYNTILQYPEKDLVLKAEKLGKSFNGKKIEDVVGLGEKLSEYGISGTIKGMIKKINEELPFLTNRLDSLAFKRTEVITVQDTIDDLLKTADEYDKIGKTKVAETIVNQAIGLEKKAKNGLSVKEAIDLRRNYDKGRQLASGALSQSQSAEQKVFRIISDDLRGKINAIPEIGKLNNQESTYMNSVKQLAKKEAKPLFKISGRFPFIGATPSKITAPIMTYGSRAIDSANKSFIKGITKASPSIIRKATQQSE